MDLFKKLDLAHSVNSTDVYLELCILFIKEELAYLINSGKITVESLERIYEALDYVVDTEYYQEHEDYIIRMLEEGVK